MNTAYQRRIKLIDARLQGRLIVPLIVMETFIVTVAMLYLYYDYSALLEEYMYSIHRLGHEDFFLRLMQELAVAVLVMTFFNVLLLTVANHLWLERIRSILSCFRQGMSAVKQLDLRSRPACPVEHEVLKQMEQWRQLEAGRYQQLREHLSRIETTTDETRLQAVRDALSVLPRQHKPI